MTATTPTADEPQATGRSSYSPAMITLHWAMAVLLAAVFATIELRELFEKGTPARDAMKSAHFMLGLAVLALVLVRLIVRSLETTPRIVPPLAPWQALASRAIHLALYGLMIAMPILGWLILSAEGKPIPFFGLSLPALIGENKDLAHGIEEVHEALGTAFYILIGVHTAAALLHHYVQRDNTLARMLRWRAA